MRWESLRVRGKVIRCAGKIYNARINTSDARGKNEKKERESFRVHEKIQKRVEKKRLDTNRI